MAAKSSGYSPTSWNDGDIITKDKLNNIESGIQAASKAGLSGSASAVSAIDTPESADAATIAAKVNELITQLKARGVIS
ncbi:hypothetical protein [Zhenpiania hominis]|uniref:Head fiber protein n=1 Tax=Zhenpiania hominis TaxID=2763644 RepID=A0A923NNJ5_9FIRM|nr:hypothetical protein [Zhenpiania hominis]MBC6681322.1 hypothetical protein [Zhenpiania hominis]